MTAARVRLARYPLGHLEVALRRTEGVLFFAIFAGGAGSARPLFSGPAEPDLPAQLRGLADAVDVQLEAHRNA